MVVSDASDLSEAAHSPSADEARPNFVIFLPDQLRADSLSCYGNGTTATPNFDLLASQGVRFDQCHTQSVLCTPSRCSLLTGLYPHVSGHRNLWHLLQPQEPNLFRYLRDAGYDVTAFGKNDVFSQRAIDSSLDAYVSLPGTNSGTNPWAMDDPRRYSFLVDPFDGDPDQTSDARHVRRACDHLRSRAGGGRIGKGAPDRPFLVFIPLTLPHPPYGPPEPYYSRYRPDQVSVRPPLEGAPEFHELVRRYRNLPPEDDELFRKIRAVYYGMVDYVDWLLGKVMATLAETGLDASTYLIAASDHGDLAGDYGLVEKIHNAHYDPLTRVPLVIRPAASSQADLRAPGGVVGRPTALMDIMATVFDAAGIQATHSHFSRSLLPDVVDRCDPPPGPAISDIPAEASARAQSKVPRPPAWTCADDAVFTENGFRLDETHCFEGSFPGDGTWDPQGHYYPQTMQHQERPDTMDRVITMRTATEKLCYRPAGLSEYFDLESDPDELDNRYEDPIYSSRVRDMESRLLRWLAQTSDTVPYHHDPRGFPQKEWPNSEATS